MQNGLIRFGDGWLISRPMKFNPFHFMTSTIIYIKTKFLSESFKYFELIHISIIQRIRIKNERNKIFFGLFALLSLGKILSHPRGFNDGNLHPPDFISIRP